MSSLSSGLYNLWCPSSLLNRRKLAANSPSSLLLSRGHGCLSQSPESSSSGEFYGTILLCKVGVTIFSPCYSDSVSCLRELALLMEAEKKVIPIFFNVKPSQLRTVDLKGRFNGCTNKEVLKFRSALDEAAGIVGLSFDSSKGDWSALLKDTVDAIMEYI